jgi:hypothetical protein
MIYRNFLFLTIAMVSVLSFSGCNGSTDPSQTETPQNFINDLQASGASEADSKIIKASDDHPGVIVIYDSALNSDMAIDLSGSMNFSGIYGNLSENHSTAQGEVSDYLAHTGYFARAVQPVAVLASGSQVFQDSKGNIYSQDQSTRDTDLQQADIQSADVATRAQFVAQSFQMSNESATQLVVLSDKVQLLTAQGAMTAEDRAAITESTLGVAGLTSADINQAISSVIQTGKTDQIDALMQKAAGNMGISSDNLKGKLLPALGLNLGN